MRINFGLIVSMSFLNFFGAAFAQQGVHSSGGEANATSGSVSYSIGQVSYINSTTTSGTITEGVQQPIELYSLSAENSEAFIYVNAYPNPTDQNLFVEISRLEFAELNFILTDAGGKIIQHELITDNLLFIGLSEYESGIYFLNLYSSDSLKQTIKIVKN